MRRKVGNFYDEKTGEHYWLEPESISLLLIRPRTVLEVGQATRQIKYLLSSDESTKLIIINASLSISDDCIISANISLDEHEFAQMLFNACKNNQLIEKDINFKKYVGQVTSSLIKIAKNKYDITLVEMEDSVWDAE